LDYESSLGGLMKKAFYIFGILFVLMVVGFPASPFSGIATNYLRLEPSGLPAVCRQGDLRVDIITGSLELCDNANAWGAFGAVSGGGTGLATATAHSVIVGNGTSPFTQVGPGAAGSVFTGAGASADPAFTVTPTLGVAGTSLGSLGLSGNTSGVVTVKPQAAAGTYNFNLPTSAGTSGQPLLSAGGGSSPMTFGVLGTTYGGTGQNFSSSSGALSVSSGTVSAGTLSLLNGGTGTAAASANAAFNALSPMTTIGDTMYGASVGVATRLAGNATTTKKFLSQTGDGSNALAPSWAQPACADISNAVASCSTDTTNASNISSGTLVVARGGTGQATLTNHGVLIGAGTSAITQLAAAGAGTMLQGVASSDPAFSATPTLGLASSATGKLNLAGTTSGTVTIQPQDAAGTFNFNLPTTAGTSGFVLTSAGGGSSPMTWSNVVTNPMTTGGDIIYGGASGAPTRLANGSNGQVLTSAGSTNAPTWAAIGNITVVTKTTTYNIAATDGLILCSGSAFTVTLPTAVGVTGETHRIKKTDSSLTNIITVATTSSQTIDGATTTTLNTQYEEIVVVSDGSNWQVSQRLIPSPWTAYTPTITGAGTPTNVQVESRRNGPNLEVRAKWTHGTVSASTAALTLGFGGTNSNVTIATSTITTITIVGIGGQAANSSIVGSVLATNGGTSVNFSLNGTASGGFLAAQAGNVVWTNSVAVSYVFSVPIAGWNG
jgi:hypothetical protein